MGSPVTELKNLINPDNQASIGTVAVDRGEVALVATAMGMTEVPKSNTTKYASGDTVRMFNGVLVGKVNSYDRLPVYYV